MEKKEYKVYLELIRIVACFMVVFNHTEENGFLLYTSTDYHNVAYWIYHFIAVFVKANVPLFIMVSGAILLEKNDSIKKVYSKRIPRILAVLFIFSLISYIETILINGEGFDIRYFLVTFISSERHNWSYWYLYSYMAMLAAVPILALIAKNMSHQIGKYLFVLMFVINGYTAIQYLLFQSNFALYSAFFPRWLAEQFVVCPLLGYYLSREIKFNRKEVSIWIVADVLFMGLACFANWYVCSYKGAGYTDTREVFNDSFNILNVVTIFIVLRCVGERISNDRVREWIVRIGQSTLGIYLLHIILMRLPIMRYVWKARDKFHINGMLMGIGYAAFIFCAGFVITQILKKIPGIKKLL